MGWGSRARRWIGVLVQVPETGDPDLDGRGRFLAALLLISLPLLGSMAMGVIPYWLNPESPTSTQTFRAASLMTLATAASYFANRRGAQRLATGIFLFAAATCLGWACGELPALLIFFVLPQLVIVALLPLGPAALVSLGAILFGHAVPLVSGSARPHDLVLPLCLNLFFLPLTLVLQSYHRSLERRRVSDLQRREQWFATTLSSIGDAVLTASTDAKISFLNPVAEALTGWSLKDAQGAKLEEVFRIINEQTGAPAEHPVSKVLRTGTVVGLANHTLLIARDGTRRPIADSGAPIRTTNGEILGVVLVFRDVSREQDLQARVLHSQRLDALGQLAGGIAHDFNNLLTVIGGSCEMALEELTDPRAVRSELEQVLGAAQHAGALTSQLLAFSRRQIMQPKPVNLNAALTGMAKILERLLRENIHIENDLDAATGWVMIDPTQLEQVVFNLAINAADAMPSGGTLALSTARVQVTAEAPVAMLTAGAYGRLRVTDTGTGMEQSVLLHVFEPFFTTKERGRGTGLGLSTAYGIVQQSGGAILVQSAKGRGTTFDIFIPSAASPEQNARTPSGHPPPQASAPTKTVLVVEDDPMVRHLVVRTLQRPDLRILEADSGNAALARLDTRSLGQIHLLITDIVMPGATGVEVARRFRVRYPSLPVLFMSGYADELFAHKGVEELDGTFLAKPFAPAALRAAVETALGG